MQAFRTEQPRVGFEDKLLRAQLLGAACILGGVWSRQSLAVVIERKAEPIVVVAETRRTLPQVLNRELDLEQGRVTGWAVVFLEGPEIESRMQ